MAQEDYCSFETSKLLKECGFPQDGALVWAYNDKGKLVDRSKVADYITLATPTLALAMKWLREEKDIWIHIKKNSHNLDWRSCPYKFKKYDSGEYVNYPIADYRYTRTYEEAAAVSVIVALQYLKEQEQL